MDALYASFTEVIAGYRDFMPGMLMMAATYSPPHEKVVLSFLQKHGSLESSSTDMIIYKVDYLRVKELDNIFETITSAKRAVHNLPRMLLMGLMSSLDYHLSNLYRIIMLTHPDMLKSDEKMIAVTDVLSSSSIKDVKKKIINTEVDRITRDSLAKQMSWIEKRMKIPPLSSFFERWNELIEAVERRNLFVHNNGVINDQYLKAVETSQNDLGTVLHADATYYANSVSTVEEFGSILTQLVWRKLDKDSDITDKALVKHTFYLIQSGHYRTAITILGHMLKSESYSTEHYKRIMIVNCANAMRLSDDKDASLKLLAGFDWSATSRMFRICVASVRGEIGTVVELMKEIGPSGDLSAEDYEDWPVFYRTRDELDFRLAFAETFGRDFEPKLERKSYMADLFGILAGLEDEVVDEPLEIASKTGEQPKEV